MDNKIRASLPPDANKFNLGRIKYLKQKYRNDCRPVKIAKTKIMIRIDLNRIDVSRLFSKYERKCTKSIIWVKKCMSVPNTGFRNFECFI